MRWALVNSAYFNTYLIQAFHWSAGKLYVYWQGDEDFETYADPDRANYLRLCHAAGVRPVEEVGARGEG